MPIYETPYDRDIQHKVCCHLCKHWSITAVPTPAELRAIYDYALIRFDPMTTNPKFAILEIKSYARWTYGTPYFRTSKRKWDGLLSMSAELGINALLAVHDKSDNAIRAIVVKDEYVVGIDHNFGRNDRPNDPNARESAVIIDTQFFWDLGALK